MAKNKNRISRRKFIGLGSCGAMSLAPFFNTISQLTFINSASASALTTTPSDYKALICVFLGGGCDTNNVLIPRKGHPAAEAYTRLRSAVAVPNGVVHPDYNPSGRDDTIPIQSPPTQPFGMGVELKNLAAAYNNGEAAIVQNVGALVEPLTASTYGTARLPGGVFGHDVGAANWMSSIAEKPFNSGWGARMAELYNDTWNPQSRSTMLIGLEGNVRFLSGSDVLQYNLNPTGALPLEGFGGSTYGWALDEQGEYKQNQLGEELKAVDKIMGYEGYSHMLHQSYKNAFRNARTNEGIINQALAAEQSLNLDFDGIWRSYSANTDFGNKLKAIARVIAGRSSIGNMRQIFYVNLSGWDHHNALLDNLNNHYTYLDNGLGAFNAGMKALAENDPSFDYNSVVTFQASDFNRTFVANGIDPLTAGSDHAWGSHCFVMGGAVNGGQLYGQFPELAIGGPDATPFDSRGRWIPSTAIDQYVAVLANWFGVPLNSTEMETILPNLYRFTAPLGSEANLAFL